MDQYLENICKLCISVTNRLLLKSNTRDISTGQTLSPNTLHHETGIFDMRQMTPVQNRTSSAYIDHCLKFSIGNCAEFTDTCAFLLFTICKTNQILKHRRIKVHTAILSQGDHSFCLIEENNERMIIDPWSKLIMSDDAYLAFVRGHKHHPFFHPQADIEIKNHWSSTHHFQYLHLFLKYNISSLFISEIRSEKERLNHISNNINLFSLL